MIYIVGSVVTIVAITFAAAWLGTSRWPHRTQRWQVAFSALSVPLLSVALFAVAVLATLADAPAVPERGTMGMVIFSMVFFLFYAVVAGFVVGIPTAMIAVRILRRQTMSGDRTARGWVHALPISRTRRDQSL